MFLCTATTFVAIHIEPLQNTFLLNTYCKTWASGVNSNLEQCFGKLFRPRFSRLLKAVIGISAETPYFGWKYLEFTIHWLVLFRHLQFWHFGKLWQNLLFCDLKVSKVRNNPSCFGRLGPFNRFPHFSTPPRFILRPISYICVTRACSPSTFLLPLRQNVLKRLRASRHLRRFRATFDSINTAAQYSTRLGRAVLCCGGHQFWLVAQQEGRLSQHLRKPDLWHHRNSTWVEEYPPLADFLWAGLPLQETVKREWRKDGILLLRCCLRRGLAEAPG